MGAGIDFDDQRAAAVVASEDVVAFMEARRTPRGAGDRQARGGRSAAHRRRLPVYRARAALGAWIVCPRRA